MNEIRVNKLNYCWGSAKCTQSGDLLFLSPFDIRRISRDQIVPVDTSFPSDSWETPSFPTPVVSTHGEFLELGGACMDCFLVPLSDGFSFVNTRTARVAWKPLLDVQVILTSRYCAPFLIAHTEACYCCEIDPQTFEMKQYRLVESVVPWWGGASASQPQSSFYCASIQHTVAIATFSALNMMTACLVPPFTYLSMHRCTLALSGMAFHALFLLLPRGEGVQQKMAGLTILSLCVGSTDILVLLLGDTVMDQHCSTTPCWDQYSPIRCAPTLFEVGGGCSVTASFVLMRCTRAPTQKETAINKLELWQINLASLKLKRLDTVTLRFVVFNLSFSTEGWFYLTYQDPVWNVKQKAVRSWKALSSSRSTSRETLVTWWLGEKRGIQWARRRSPHLAILFVVGVQSIILDYVHGLSLMEISDRLKRSRQIGENRREQQKRERKIALPRFSVNKLELHFSRLEMQEAFRSWLHSREDRQVIPKSHEDKKKTRKKARNG
jgi:hypothetical protein